MKRLFFSTAFILVITSIIISVSGIGCAVIVPPGGGPKDTIPPALVKAVPNDSSLNFKGNKIILTFDEYVQLDNNLNDNLIVSPVPNTLPFIESKLHNVTVKLKDSLEANTTYAINFGKAIKDVNEGLPYKDFTYVFSTGNHIDENTFSGTVKLAETGKVDSALVVVLHNNLSDSAAEKVKPRYFAKLDGKGNFTFHFLPPGKFNAFVVPNDYSKKYDDTTKMFAFLNEPVIISDTASTQNVLFYAYQQAKEKPKPATTSSNSNNEGSRQKKKDKDEEKKEDKRLKIAPGAKDQGLLEDYEFTFSRKLKTFDSAAIALTDTNYKAIKNFRVFLDTTRTKVKIKFTWPESTEYRLVIDKSVGTDSADIAITKNDTLSFTTKSESDYGSIKLRFNDVDLSKNPVLLMMKGEDIYQIIPLVTRDWYQKLYEPGDYEMRILYDKNKNGVWDPGNYKDKKQPEIVEAVTRKLNIKANLDNDVEINLTGSR
jgi:hypothetical protein